ncbi:ABC transporter ATP-binding protein [Parapedobacter sp. GCM10030251]
MSDINLRVPIGSIYGYLGRNGAGKSTTIKLLLGLLKSAEDNILIQGISLKQRSTQIHSIAGNLIEAPCFYNNLTVYENLRYLDIIHKRGLRRIDEVLALVNLHLERKKKASALSMGMKQRLGIAMAIFHDPQLLILDEPLNGLDPQGIFEMRKLFQSLNEQGKTIFLSSHILSELEKVATHIGIIESGRMIFQGTKDDLLLGKIERHVRLRIDDVETAIDVLSPLGFSLQHLGANRVLVIVNDDQHFNSLVKNLICNKIGIYDMESQNANLEQTFINLISRAND